MEEDGGQMYGPRGCEVRVVISYLSWQIVKAATAIQIQLRTDTFVSIVLMSITDVKHAPSCLQSVSVNAD